MAVLARMASVTDGGFSGGQNTLVRFAIGTGLCLAAFAARPGTFRPIRPGLLATRGLVGGVAVVLYFHALSRIPAGQATLLNSLFPLLATLMASFVLRERPTPRLVIALVITSAGMVMVLGKGARGFELGPGQLAGFASAFLSAGAILSIRALRTQHNTATIFFAFCVGGLLAASPFVLQTWQHSPQAWALAIGSALAGVASHLWMTHALGALTVPEAAVLQQLAPVTCYLWAVPLLDETPRWPEAVGVLCVTLGVIHGAVRLLPRR
jgi:drug/metabolite transporter (DMT)-like permease